MADDDFDLDAMLEDAAGEVFSGGVDMDSMLDDAADEVMATASTTTTSTTSRGPIPASSLDAVTENKVGGEAVVHGMA